MGNHSKKLGDSIKTEDIKYKTILLKVQLSIEHNGRQSFYVMKGTREKRRKERGEVDIKG